MLHHPVRVLQGGRVVAHAVVQQRKAKVHQEAGHYGHPVHQGPGLALNGNVQHLDAEARGANGGSKLPDVHVAVIVHKEWHKEDDDALVQGVEHVHPEGVLGVCLERKTRTGSAAKHFVTNQLTISLYPDAIRYKALPCLVTVLDNWHLNSAGIFALKWQLPILIKMLVQK